ncbi:uncharacterized protein FIBRA_01678 [Fibroporia radiculosa]|uniref:Uncharacterized protein n=1 Tax=Fibroporia radiculosa TaxID=599839 RepID=J4G144_9APHY|nr:uncharacterized protein FIBRA_01678 [Fibroporia radiculosa]CCL99658.1 predicted protein [Fibroporia radiculosa]
MTRYTDVGRKRTYLQAGLNHKERRVDLTVQEIRANANQHNAIEMEIKQDEDGLYPQKRRKSKEDTATDGEISLPGESVELTAGPRNEREQTGSGKSRSASSSGSKNTKKDANDKRTLKLKNYKEVASAALFLGTGLDAGADEDDFHLFKRRNAEVDRTEKTEERLKRKANIRVGAHTGIIRSFPKRSATPSMKVVKF